MFKLWNQSRNTKKFINNYPGLTDEEKELIKGMRERCAKRYNMLQSISMNVTILFTAFGMAYILKYNPARGKALALLLLIPLGSLMLSYTVPEIDFYLFSGTYKEEIMASTLKTAFERCIS